MHVIACVRDPCRPGFLPAIVLQITGQSTKLLTASAASDTAHSLHRAAMVKVRKDLPGRVDPVHCAQCIRLAGSELKHRDPLPPPALQHGWTVSHRIGHALCILAGCCAS